MTEEDVMVDEDIRVALAPYRQVRASERLRVAATRPANRTSSPTTWRRRRRVMAVGAATAAAVAAAVVVVVAAVTDGPDRADLRAEAAGRKVDISGAQAVVFADGTTVPLEELLDSANHERLQAVFAEHDARLDIVERPVAPAADGRVFTIMGDVGGDDTLSDTVRVEPGVRITVEVGRGDPSADTEGLTLYEVFPEVEEAFDRDDPAATGEALERLGFTVHWVHIEAAGVGRDVDAPPPGTVVLSILGPEGQWTDIDRAIDTLMVEVAAPDVAVALGH